MITRSPTHEIPNSPGVLAALRAGMQVIGFARETPAPDLTAVGAHQVFATMAELHAFLKQAL